MANHPNRSRRGKPPADRPMTEAERVKASRDRAKAKGARMVGPVFIRDTEALRQLDALTEKAGSLRAAIEQAIRASYRVTFEGTPPRYRAPRQD